MILTRFKKIQWLYMGVCYWMAFGWAIRIESTSAFDGHPSLPNAPAGRQLSYSSNQLFRGSIPIRRLQTLTTYRLPGFIMTMKVGSDGLELVAFTDALKTVTEDHIADVLLDELPATGPLSDANFEECFLTSTVAASPFDDVDVLLQVNFTGGLLFSDASLPANSSFVESTILDAVKAAFLTADGYNDFVARIKTDAELQRIKGVKVSVNPNFDPVQPPASSPSDAPSPTAAPAAAADAQGIGTMMIIVIVIVVLLVLAMGLGSWYYCRRKKAEDRRKQAAKLALQRSERIRRQQSTRSLGSSSAGSGKDGSSTNRSTATGSSSRDAANTRPKSNKKVVPQATYPRPALQSRRALSLMAITEHEDESEVSGEISAELRGSQHQKRLIASDSALGERDISESSVDDDDLYEISTSAPSLRESPHTHPRNSKRVSATEQALGAENGEDDDDVDEPVSSADEEFENELRELSPKR